MYTTKYRDQNRPGAAVRPDQEEVINEQGFRGEELPPSVGSDHVRIVCLGDSSTFGAHVESNETFSACLERILRDCGVNADVLNAGVIGYSSQQSRRLLEQDILSYVPDVVVLYLGAINDGRPARSLPDKRKLEKINSTPSLSARLNRVVQRLRFGQLPRRLAAPAPDWREQFMKQGFQPLNPENARSGLYTKRVSLEDFRDNVTACARAPQDID